MFLERRLLTRPIGGKITETDRGRQGGDGIPDQHRRRNLRFRDAQGLDGQGDPATRRRSARRDLRDFGRRKRRRPHDPRRRAAEAHSRRTPDPLRGGRDHPPHPRHARRRRVRSGVVPHRRRIPRLPLVGCRDRGTAGRNRARFDARDGRGGLEDHAQSGSRARRAKVPGRHALPQHHRPAGHHVRPPAAEPPDRRPGRHHRGHCRWPDVRRWRRGHRHQPRGSRRSPASSRT